MPRQKQKFQAHKKVPEQARPLAVSAVNPEDKWVDHESTPTYFKYTVEQNYGTHITQTSEQSGLRTL